MKIKHCQPGERVSPKRTPHQTWIVTAERKDVDTPGADEQWMNGVICIDAFDRQRINVHPEVEVDVIG